MKIEEPAREGFLYQIWLDKGFGKCNLFTIDGKPVEIREKGVYNTDAGPDFKNALILLNDRLERGDIEIHPVAGDWYAHGHHQDPHYNNVILHVVTMNCPSNFITINNNGKIIPTLNMDTFLSRPAEELEQSTLESFNESFDEKTRCALAAKSPVEIQQVIEKYADERFHNKSEQFFERRHLFSWDQIFYEAMLEAFGYSKNQIPFRNMAQKLPVETIWNYIWKDSVEIALHKCEAFLFGVAGMIPVQSDAVNTRLSPEVENYVIRLEKTWDQFPERNRTECLKPQDWKFFRMRPQNFPTRRIAAAATLVLRFMDDGFLGTILKAISSCEVKVKNIAKEIEQLFLVKANDFWLNHFNFDDSLMDKVAGNKAGTYIIGMERARDISVNIVLPVVYAFGKESDDGRLTNKIKELYLSYPRNTENEITRKMRSRIFGHYQDGKELITGIRQQQGLIQICKFMCSPGDCVRCIR